MWTQPKGSVWRKVARAYTRLQKIVQRERSLTVGDASPRQARGHIGDGCVEWEHFSRRRRRRRRSDGDGTGLHRKSWDEFKAWFRYDNNSDRTHMSPIDRGHIAEASSTVTIIWKPGFSSAHFASKIVPRLAESWLQESGNIKQKGPIICGMTGTEVPHFQYSSRILKVIWSENFHFDIWYLTLSCNSTLVHKKCTVQIVKDVVHNFLTPCFIYELSTVFVLYDWLTTSFCFQKVKKYSYQVDHVWEI